MTDKQINKTTDFPRVDSELRRGGWVCERNILHHMLQSPSFPVRDGILEVFLFASQHVSYSHCRDKAEKVSW